MRLPCARLLIVAFLVAGHIANAYAERRKVLIIPGITGSLSTALFCNSPGDVEDVERWLRHNYLNRSRSVDIPEAWVLDPVLFTYTDLEFYLLGDGLLPKPIPCDWRLKIEEIATQFVKPVVDEAVRADEEINIVAHSMGGLVIRSYIQQYGSRGIRKIAFLGTPHRGSVDAYYLWEGGKATALTVWDAAGVEILLDNIKEGCGCGLRNDAKFVRFGCLSGSVGPITSVNQLMPVFPFLKKSRNGSLYPIEEMCEQNTFLRELNATAENQLVDSGIEFRVFAGDTEWTPRAIVPDRLPKQNCDRIKWPDRSPHYILNGYGDNRVLFNESACPKEYIPAFENIKCVTEDTIYPEGEKAVAIAHGELPNIFKEEIAEFLLACKEGEHRPCYDGPAGTENFGICRAGYQECRDGAFGDCNNQSLPTAEICDGLDTNCDGIPDPPGCVCFPGVNHNCYTGPFGTAGVGVCHYGFTTCKADGTGFGACVGEVTPLLADICGNGSDDNCNYTIDDGCGGNPSFMFKHYPYAEGGICLTDGTSIVTHPHVIRDFRIGVYGSSSNVNLLIIPVDGFRDPVEITVDRVGTDNGPLMPAGIGPCSCYDEPCPGNGVGDVTDGFDSMASMSLDIFDYEFDLSFERSIIATAGDDGVYRYRFSTAHSVTFEVYRRNGVLNGRYIIYLRATSTVDPTKTAEIGLVLVATNDDGTIFGEI